MKFPKKVNWWILILPANVGDSVGNANILNTTLITSRFLPEGDIKTSKSINYTEYQVAGLDYVPTNYVLNGNTTFTVRVPVVNKFDKQFGNTSEIMAFERLRTQQTPIGQTKNTFSRNPVVIWYGYTNRPPLPCLVKSCDITHVRDHFLPRYGTTSFSYVDLTMQYIENNSLYQMWKYVQLAGSQYGMARNMTRKQTP